MSKRVLIVGAGIVGCCCGYFLARRGFEVTIVDRGESSDENCSFGNAGLISPSHFVPLTSPGVVAKALRMMFNPTSPFLLHPRPEMDLIKWCWKFWRAATPKNVERFAPLMRDLLLASRACYAEFAEDGDEFALNQRGMLMLCKTEQMLEKEARLVEHASRLGVPAEILNKQQLAQREPLIEMNVAGAVCFPQDCCLTPAKLMAFVRKKVIENGGRFLWTTQIRNWKTSGAKIRAATGESGNEKTQIEADEFVICAGSWSAKIAKQLGFSLPLQAGKGYSLTLPNPPQLPQISAILTEAHIAVTPMENSLRFAGTMEIGVGLDQRINPRRPMAMIARIPDYYPAFSPRDFAGVQPWCGLRPCSPDGAPYIGRASQYENLSFATGHGMLGVSMGAVTGKLISQILSGEQTLVDIYPLSPARYGY